MFKLIAISAVALVAANSAFAQEATTTEPVVNEQLAVMFKSVCDSKAVKSKKLTDACNLNEMPKPLKSGKAFRASGIGGEVNVIFANIELINN